MLLCCLTYAARFQVILKIWICSWKGILFLKSLWDSDLEIKCVLHDYYVYELKILREVN